MSADNIKWTIRQWVRVYLDYKSGFGSFEKGMGAGFLLAAKSLARLAKDSGDL